MLFETRTDMAFVHNHHHHHIHCHTVDDNSDYDDTKSDAGVAYEHIAGDDVDSICNNNIVKNSANRN